ncbi:MAG: hypothetical protein K0S32_2936 [Bacteroidetes bacterium]|jgi:hypothetical protein|nr:hypothetical protein [Bacteroidota bacterium]
MGITAVIVHFSLLFFYAFVPNRYSSFYVYPYFYQDWRLFVPAPDSNYKLYATYDDSGAKTTDVFTELMNKHQSNRASGNEPLMIALSNSIHYFEKVTDPGKITDTKEGTKFSLVEKFARNYIEETRNIKLNQLKLILVVTSTDSSQTKVYYN